MEIVGRWGETGGKSRRGWETFQVNSEKDQEYRALRRKLFDWGSRGKQTE